MKAFVQWWERCLHDSSHVSFTFVVTSCMMQLELVCKQCNIMRHCTQGYLLRIFPSFSQTWASYPDLYECMSSVSVKRCPNLLTSIHEWKLTTRMPDLKEWFLQAPAFSYPNLNPGSPTRTSSKTTTVSYLTSRSWQITTSACKRSSEARVFAYMSQYKDLTLSWHKWWSNLEPLANFTQIMGIRNYSTQE